jgi:hypothetical protein
MFRGYDGCGISAYCRESGTPLETFIGWRCDCEACFNPFRRFRPNETHCGCYRHLKPQHPVPERA